MLTAIRRSLGGITREAGVYLSIDWLKPRTAPSVLFFPSQGLDDGAARLRVYAVAEELESFGWRTAISPKQLSLSARRRLIRVFKPDVILMQTARHSLNRPKLYPGQLIVVDLDDADYVNPASAPAIVDAVGSSAGVIAGSRSVARFCRTYNDNVTVVWTGTPPSRANIEPQFNRERIVTWAASSPLGSPKEAAFVRQILELLQKKNVKFNFRIYCDDDTQSYRNFVKALIPLGVHYETFPYLAYPAFLRSLDSVAVGLAPLIDLEGFSGGKSFGKVLAYLDRSVPVLTHAAVDHPLFFRHGANGLMLDSAAEWANAIEQLLDDPQGREAIAAVAHQDFVRRLASGEAARHVDRFLRDTIKRHS